ncbi:hypothetical protein MHBO_004668 [Bonamia ostreae]|uniref:Uncharacterized protein n=1 Tax=Bonamia ostreae TaxID=126728 RepID=A0ABV2AUL9_9EUKA
MISEWSDYIQDFSREKKILLVAAILGYLSQVISLFLGITGYYKYRSFIEYINKAFAIFPIYLFFNYNLTLFAIFYSMRESKSEMKRAIPSFFIFPLSFTVLQSGFVDYLSDRFNQQRLSG